MRKPDSLEEVINRNLSAHSGVWEDLLANAIGEWIRERMPKRKNPGKPIDDGITPNTFEEGYNLALADVEKALLGEKKEVENHDDYYT